MKKHVLIKLVLFVVIFGISFWNVKQQQETVSLRETIVALNEDKTELKVKKAELINQNDQLTKQVAASSKSLKEFKDQNNNSGVDTDVNTEFINIVTKLFEANLNFTPENYENRKQEVSGYLSDELKKEYFGQSRNTYQDVNGSVSQLESLEIYSKTKKFNEIEGLVVAYHKGKKRGKEWKHGINIFKVSYDFKSMKVKKITNLGNGYSNK